MSILRSCTIKILFQAFLKRVNKDEECTIVRPLLFIVFYMLYVFCSFSISFPHPKSHSDYCCEKRRLFG